jgi:hypothetical protein
MELSALQESDCTAPRLGAGRIALSGTGHRSYRAVTLLQERGDLCIPAAPVPHADPPPLPPPVPVLNRLPAVQWGSRPGVSLNLCLAQVPVRRRARRRCGGLPRALRRPR